MHDEARAETMFEQAYETSLLRPETAEAVAIFYLQNYRETLAVPWVTRALEEGKKLHRIPKMFENHSRLFYLAAQYYLDQGMLDAAEKCFDEANDDTLSSSERGIKYVSLAQMSWKNKK